MHAAFLAAVLSQLVPIPLSDGGPLGLDDLGVTQDGRFLIPTAELGTVLLLSPDGGTSQLAVPSSGARRIGLAILDEEQNANLLIAADRAATTLVVVGQGEVVTLPLAGRPDYVRQAGNQIWVTEPHLEQIEVLGVTSAPLTVGRLTAIPISGGPEALALDPVKGNAYTFSEKHDRLIRIDLVKHLQTAAWPLSCPGAPKGLATAFSEGLAFVGCSGGLVLTVSLLDGHRISSLVVGQGVDIIAFDPARRRLYVPAAKSATLTIASVAPDGSLRKLRALATVAGAHCVAARDGVAVLCDPSHGRLLRLDDRR